MDERSAEKAIKALNKAGAIKVGTAEGTPVSREHAREIVRAIRKQKRNELTVDDIVTFLREDACQYGEWENACTAEGPCPSCMAADEIERLRSLVRDMQPILEQE